MPDPFHRREERKDDMPVARDEKVVLLVKGHRSGEVAATDAQITEDAPSLLPIATMGKCANHMNLLRYRHLVYKIIHDDDIRQGVNMLNADKSICNN
jgi:hypothetical protein